MQSDWARRDFPAEATRLGYTLIDPGPSEESILLSERYLHAKNTGDLYTVHDLSAEMVRKARTDFEEAAAALRRAAENMGKIWNGSK